jgi:DNA-binding beta-propeller fold protein YncE
MSVFRGCLAVFAYLAVSAGVACAATFGTVVPVRGHVSDIALDTNRGVLYAANFTANRIEVLSLATDTLQSFINVAAQPSAVTVSPDGHFLVIGHYGVGSVSPFTGLTVVNLDNRQQQTISLGTDSVLAAEFGNGSQALIVTTTAVSLLDPATGTLSPLTLKDSASTALTVPWASFPAGIISGSAGVSGDGNIIYALIDNGSRSDIIRYSTLDGGLVLAGSTSTPPQGPRAVSVDRSGATFLSGWNFLSLRASLVSNEAQFPYPTGVLFQGGHAFD